MPLYFYVNKHLVSPRVTGWYDNVLNVVYSKDSRRGLPWLLTADSSSDSFQIFARCRPDAPMTVSGTIARSNDQSPPCHRKGQ